MLRNLILRLLGLVGLLVLALLLVVFAARPALAQEATVNYTYAQLENQDFSHQNLAKGEYKVYTIKEFY